MRPAQPYFKRAILAVMLWFGARGSAGAETNYGAWQAATAPLMTRWAEEVGPTNALPEYPRPQLVRPDWLNLNGLWGYAITSDSQVKAPAGFKAILVPFPVESALSGVMTNFDEHSKLWYRRTVAIPAAWRGRRIRLHFGAVDWRCAVAMNGRPVGQHQGGYDAFSFDVTDALTWNGAEELTVCVTDPTEGDQPRGKQSRKPEGIFYTATSGIWQTVWLEPVPQPCIDRVKNVPDVDGKSVRLWASVNSLSDSLKVEAVASVNGKAIAKMSGVPNSELVLKLPNPHLWTPDDPYLYDLTVTLKEGEKVIDEVTSYFGMRKIALRKDEQGFVRIALNDRFVFEIGTLDQGFWPDGVYTAPTDAALRSDIEFLKQAGFNFTRKHVKVEPERWYYWCDKLGLLVWQDMPSANNATSGGRRDFESELLRLVQSLSDHPSIIVWVLFNEGWGQYDTKSLAEWLKQLDPSRLVDDASGWTDMRAGDLIDMHNYPGPDSPTPESQRAAVLGEFGGYGCTLENHTWPGTAWGYSMLPDSNVLTARYTRSLKQLWKLHDLHGLSAAVYTQTADVETECDGLLTYDRAVAKINPNVLAGVNRGGLSEIPKKVILPDALFGRTSWKYTIDKPPTDWFQPEFNASAWKEGVGGFGSTGTPGIFLNTVWKTADIWMRRSFSLAKEDFPLLKLHVFHDEDAEIYINGVLAARLSGFNTDYEKFDLSLLGKSALKAGDNTIAVHCHQTSGGQGIDVGIILPQTSEEGKGSD